MEGFRGFHLRPELLLTDPLPHHGQQCPASGLCHKGGLRTPLVRLPGYTKLGTWTHFCLPSSSLFRNSSSPGHRARLRKYIIFRRARLSSPWITKLWTSAHQKFLSEDTISLCCCRALSPCLQDFHLKGDQEDVLF